MIEQLTYYEQRAQQEKRAASIAATSQAAARHHELAARYAGRIRLLSFQLGPRSHTPCSIPHLVS